MFDNHTRRVIIFHFKIYIKKFSTKKLLIHFLQIFLLLKFKGKNRLLNMIYNFNFKR